MNEITLMFLLLWSSGSHLTSAVYVRSPEEVVVGNGTTDTEPVLNQQSSGALMQKEPPPDPVCGVPAKTPKVPRCSTDGLGIVNGEEAVPHSWPWQVSLKKNWLWDSDYFCGGSLINKNWVVTAAHCGVSTFHRAILGLHDRRYTNNVQTMKIEKVFNHPNYNGKPFDNDIALIKLQSPAKIDRAIVYPVCVAETCDKFADGTKCVATGWGLNSYKIYPDQLQQVCLPLFDDKTCIVKWKKEKEPKEITRRMLCAGGEDRGGTCYGDSGGPLVCEMNGAWTLVGVTSWGPGDCNSRMPHVYSRITALRAWMDDIMDDN